jgi:hypothetical protein
VRRGKERRGEEVNEKERNGKDALAFSCQLAVVVREEGPQARTLPEPQRASKPVPFKFTD